MFAKVLVWILKYPKNYIKIQSIMGADRLRKKCIEMIQPRSEDCILDIGCGPAQILDFIPEVKQYYGFDTEKKYIDYASKKYGTRGKFYLCEFNTAFLASTKLEPIDKVFLIGIFHHISDEVAIELLQLIYQVLKPGGSIVTLDPCFVPNQSIISKFIARNDRGKFVRDEVGYLSLVENQFKKIDKKILNNTGRLPSTEIIMVATK